MEYTWTCNWTRRLAEKEQIINKIREIAGTTDEMGDGRFIFYDTRWPEVDQDMTESSRAFPSVLFELLCDGSERIGLYVTWYLNGQYYRQ